MKHRYVLILIAMSMGLSASPFSVDCKPRTIQLGDIITYRITLPKAYPVLFEKSWPPTGNLTLLVVTESVHAVRTRTYYLAAFTLDKTWVPELHVQFKNADYILPSIAINVKSSFAKTEQKQFKEGLKPQAAMPIHWSAYLVLMLLITIIIIVAVILYRQFIHKAPLDQAHESSPIFSPYEQAVKRLALFEQSNDLSDQKRVMFELSHILREYLSRVFDRPFMEETTYEIGYSLPAIMDESLANLIISFLRHLDPVKYAKESLSMNELKGQLTQVKQLLSRVEHRHEH